MKIIPNISRLYPFYKGKGRFAQCRTFKDYAKNLPNPCEAKLHDGQTILVNPIDYIGSMLYLFGDLDPSVSYVMRKLLKPGDTFVDVGAHIGVETIPASRLCGERGHVFAFEPNPSVFNLLRDSLKVNGISNVTLLNLAVSEKEDMVCLSVPFNHTGSASVVKESDSNTTLVKAIRLDEFKELRDTSIKLLKIDVEGHEQSVLLGCEKLLTSGKIENILIEIWQSEGDDFMKKETVQMLMNYGYKPFQLVKKYSLYSDLLDIRNNKLATNSADFLFVRQK